MITTAQKKFSVITYGCQMNDHDSEIMEGLLRSRGYEKTENEHDADVVVFNTCCVREGAENRAISRAQSLAEAKERRPGLVVAMSGCVAQDQGRRLLDRIPSLDIVIGTRDYIRLPEIIEKYQVDGERVVATEDIDKPFSVNLVPIREQKLKGLVNIMYGCNNSCTYCIVPKTRGEEWSRPLAEVVEEVRGMVAQGYREIMVLGQNVNSYMTEKREDFADLLAALNEIEGLWRIRYTTSNPKSCRDRHIEAVASCDRVMENLHLPVQSGNNRVLRMMKRAYNVERYRYLVEKFRAQNPLHSLTTDIIVGFPTETDEEFEDTMNLVRDMRYDNAFMFIYSPRAGTVSADTMVDDVPMKVKKARLQRLIDLQESIALEKNQEEIGRTHQVLVEGTSKKDPGQLVGHTRTHKRVVFDANPRLIGSLVDVTITGGNGHTLVGDVVTREAAAVFQGA
ncbi:tRNA (N6-isopentenyl adenosine(37)-C2)-methylthiotransferase MiaB [Candidatus Sumerlaeota bacterium]|nr:tRNA (N6-isopentenyl adenosine(37)-C2)-methylthiotransferase MiaB [Candidatus Sumerlaeota bacterium]